MTILSTPGWADYELIDSGDGYRLERFGKYILSRPDPQIIWKKQVSPDVWKKADAVFLRTNEDKGVWKKNSAMPDKWLMTWNGLSFWAKLTPFKHTGIFPEQIVQWSWLNTTIENRKSKIGVDDRKLKIENNLSSTFNPQPPSSTHHHPSSNITILNLFGYTGIASLVAAKAGANVTHIDASKPAITWARENQLASKLEDKPIRWIPDDALKFVQREIKRGVKYDGILMDPPVFGHGPTGELWKFNEHFPLLLESCIKLLSDNPLFILINAYAISSSALMLENVLKDFTKNLGGKIEVGELALEEKTNKRLLSTGIFGRWSES